MALEKYNKKRKFISTPEPRGRSAKKGRSRFVVHKHQASHLHYDFRLELPEKIASGKIVLKSWAVPKGIPLSIGVKHLALAVEDHPVDYINFSGVIPKGNYGAGTVEIWDKGKYQLIERGAKSLKFKLQGRVLKGIYILAKFTARPRPGQGAPKNSWLIFKSKS